MKYIIFIFAFCLAQPSFAQKEDSLILLIDQVEIASINSSDEIRSYFNDVSKLMRGIKRSEASVMEEFGFRSPQHDSVLLLEETINDFLLLKMREYLSVHPYPKQLPGDTIRHGNDNEVVHISLDAVASATLIKVFVNAKETPENLDFKKLYFPKFYPAFKQGHLYAGDMWNLLYGMYRQEKKEEYIDFELGEAEQIEEMIDALQLKRKSAD